MTSYAYYRQRFFCGWWMEPFDERVLVELFSKRFSDMFFCNGRMNIFDDNFFIVPVTKRFLTITARKDVLYFLLQDLSVFFWVCVNCYTPFGKGICVFYINIFWRKILNSFFYFCWVVWFYFLRNVVNQSDVCFFFTSTDKIYRSLILW